MAQTTTNKITLLLLLTLCLGYPSALYAAQNEVDDEKEAYHADNDAYNKGQHNKTRIIKRPTADFQALLEKGRPPGGSSTDIQYFKEVKSGGLWIGKCNINAYIGASNDEEYREALGLAIYRFFGIITPDFAVSIQPVAPSVQRMLPHGTPIPVGDNTYYVDVNRPCIHIMTQFLEGFSTCGEAFKKDKQDEQKDDQKAASITDNDSPFMRAYKQAAKAKKPFHLEKNGKKYPLQGLGTMLALANFIYDMDCIGKSGGNLGYLIKGNNAQVVKIDPGMAFSFLENHTNKKFHHNPMDRKTFFGTDESATLGYAQLTPDDQKAFAAMAKRILKTPRKILKQLIYGVVVPGGWQKEMANKLLDHLIARKSLFLAAFALEIGDNLRQEITDAKHRLVGTLVHQKGAQKQFKEQIQAYQKSLAAVRAWEAKVAANRMKKQKEYQNNQAQKPVVGERFQLPAKAREDLFTGRQQERAAMAAFFGAKRKRACAFQAITGVGGMGKTHLALHYAHACVDGAQWVPHRYDAILWLYAEAGLDSQFHALAEAWGKKDCKTAQEAVAFVYQALQTKKRTLLVFDNAEQSQAIAPYLPPRRQKGLLDIILTTRNPDLDLPHYGKPTYITLAAFTKEESRLYIQKVLGHKGHSQQAMDALWETVSGLPLALNHALQYIAKGECTLAKYPARFAEHQLSLGTQLQASPVVTSVLLSVLTLREQHPLIEPFLITASYLAPKKIPAAAVFTLLGAKVTKQAKEQALNVLHKYGLLTLAATGQAFDFHRLVQQVLREWYRSKKGEAGHKALLKDWMAYFDKNLEYDDRDLDAIYRISPLMPHAYAIADADSKSIAIQKAQVGLYGHIGYHEGAGVGHYDRAKQCYEKALAIEEKHYGAGHPETARTINNLGGVLSNLGDYPSAKTYLQKALKIREKHYGANDPEAACTMGNLGNLLRDLGDYAEAKTYLEKVLKIHTQHYGADHPTTASTMMNLGNVLSDLGDYAQAKQCYEKALKIFEKHYGADHPTTAMTIENLGTVLCNQGDYAQAKIYFEKALKIKEKHYGADHPETAITMGSLGNVLCNQGDYVSAKKYYEKALKIKEKHYGADHPKTAITMGSLGSVLLNQGDYVSAKKYYEKALKINTQHYGADHPSTAGTIANLGSVLQDLGDYAEAKQCYQKALKIKEKHYGADHPTTASTIENLGTVLRNLGDYAQAKQYYQKALKIFKQHYGADHPETAGTMMNLGTVLSNLGDYAQAKQYYQKALKIKEHHYGIDHPTTATTMECLGIALTNQGDYAQAKQYYQKALKIKEQHYGAAHPTTASTIENLGTVLRNLGDYALAKEYYEKALKIEEKHYGADHPSTAMTIANLGNLFKHLGQYEKARGHYEKTIAIFTRHYGPNHVRTKQAQRNLAILEEEVTFKSLLKSLLRNPLNEEDEEKVDSKKHQKQPKDENIFSQDLLKLYAMLNINQKQSKFPLENSLNEEDEEKVNAKKDQQQPKSILDNPLKLPTDKPNTNKMYKVHKRPKDDVSDDKHISLDALADHFKNNPTFTAWLQYMQEHECDTDCILEEVKMDTLGQQTVISINSILFNNIKKYIQPTQVDQKSNYMPQESDDNVKPSALAKEHLEEEFKIKKQHYGADDPTTARSIQNLGNVLLHQGDYALAKEYYEKALKIETQHYGADHPTIAITMSNLGNVLRNLSDYAEAKKYLEKALKIFERHYGTDHPTTASTIESLGNVLADLGDYAQAKTYLEKALNVTARHYGANHPRTAGTMNNLGLVLSNLADYAEAKKYLEKALKIKEQHYGTDHPSTAITMNNLGNVLQNLGYYTEAKRYYEKALKITAQHYGATHPSTASTMSNLGSVFQDIGNYAQAMKYLEKALKIKEQHYGTDHLSTASTMSNLGDVLSDLGDYAQAMTYLEKALKINVQHYGDDHPNTAITVGTLGVVLENLGQYEKARECYQQNIKVFTEHYGPNHAETKRVKHNLAILNDKDDKFLSSDYLLDMLLLVSMGVERSTDKPNKMYKVNKRPKDDASDDEKENDTQERDCIVM